MTRPRINCYEADLVIREYLSLKAKGGKFSYMDLKPVYCIVIYEQSPLQLADDHVNYIHYGTTVFDTKADIKLLPECYLVTIDIFRKCHYHKDKGRRDYRGYVF